MSVPRGSPPAAQTGTNETTSLLADAATIRRPLMRWYRAHGRHRLPWRQTHDPYAVLISEVMLQQTQVDRVLPHYEAWLARWPTTTALASASPADVIRAWQGLGYNRRALALHRACRVVVEQHGGSVPVDPGALSALPGVGAYTAMAVACFAGGIRTTVVDTNVGRVLARVLLGRATLAEAGTAKVSATANHLLPRRGTRAHNLALMDLGATVCSARDPHCDRCPLRARCTWLRLGSPPAVATSRPAPPFAQTARFARGRIVDALRSASILSAEEVGEALPAIHAGKLAVYLDALENDGLIVARGDCWSLPGAATTAG